MRFVLALTVAGAALAVLPASAAATHGYDVDCSDFTNQEAAQDHLNAHPADPDGLDADDDGRACDSLPCPCGTGAAPAPTPAPTVTPTPTPPGAPPERIARVTKVIDGDTIRARTEDGAELRVRLIGIDTAELPQGRSLGECGSRDAKLALERLLLTRTGGGRMVRLVTDPSQGELDAFGRTLAYVDRASDGLDAGRQLARDGWAEVYIYDAAFARLATYQSAQDSARRAYRGAWSLCAGDFHLPHRALPLRGCSAPYIMYVHKVSCAWAHRQIARLKRTHQGPRGWACSSGSRYRTGGYCQRGRRIFGWHPAD